MPRIAIHLACVAICAVSPVPAQLTGLDTTDDGGQLYFSSTLQLKGTDQFQSAKIFRYVGRFELFREVKAQETFPSSGMTNFYELTDPQVSGDSRVVAYTGRAGCSGGSRCLAFVSRAGSIAGLDLSPDLLYNGTVRLSKDAKH